MTDRGRGGFGVPQAYTSNTILLRQCDVIDLDIISSLFLAKSAHILAREGLCRANEARGREYCVNPLHYDASMVSDSGTQSLGYCSKRFHGFVARAGGRLIIGTMAENAHDKRREAAIRNDEALASKPSSEAAATLSAQGGRS
jgi:hypothetical protein